jgi:hypothetical protein
MEFLEFGRTEPDFSELTGSQNPRYALVVDAEDMPPCQMASGEGP